MRKITKKCLLIVDYYIPALLFGLMALFLFVYYPLSRRKVDELQVQKELNLKEAYESKRIDI